jgi:propanediol dehydratase small subunit
VSKDYPLAEKHPDRLRTPTGRPFTEITLDAVVSGDLTMEDLRITGEALEWQARIAEAEGRPQLAENLRRAAELTRVPDERILQVYEALRPGRSDKAALERLAAELERDYGAFRCARLLRDAAG